MKRVLIVGVVPFLLLTACLTPKKESYVRWNPEPTVTAAAVPPPYAAFHECMLGPNEESGTHGIRKTGCSNHDYDYDGDVDVQDWAIHQTWDKTRTADMPDSWMVLYNINDAESDEWAHWYANLRGIPLTNLLGLDVSLEERIHLDEYLSTIFYPTRDFLRGKSHIIGIIVGYKVPGNFLAPCTQFSTTRLCPRAGHSDPNSSSGGFSVANNLADMARERNGYCWTPDHSPPGTINCTDTPPQNPHNLEVETVSLPKLNKFDMWAGNYMTARMDAPSLEAVKALSPASGTFDYEGILYQDYVDSGAPGTEWRTLKRAVNWLTEHPWQAYNSDSDLMANCLMAFSWYRLTGWQNVPWEGGGSRIFGYALSSWGATTVRSTTDDSGRFVPNALANGFVAATGATGEPYLGPEPYVSTMIVGLELGYTLGESFYRANEYTDWMWELVGDPLIRRSQNSPEIMGQGG